jgi:hypothetical protein
MEPTTYRDLAEFGLPLVPPNDPAFPALLADIESRALPPDSWQAGDLGEAAVLLNQSGRAIVGFAYVWRYRTVEGAVRPTRCLNLGSSSTELDVLSGRAAVTREISGFILPGSKRLIAEEGCSATTWMSCRPISLSLAPDSPAALEAAAFATGCATSRSPRSSCAWISRSSKMASA